MYMLSLFSLFFLIKQNFLKWKGFFLYDLYHVVQKGGVWGERGYETDGHMAYALLSPAYQNERAG